MELTDKLIHTYMNQEVSPPCVSLYIPTHPKSTSQRINEDRIRLKNALQRLEEQDVFTPELADTHSKLSHLVDDNEFWLHQSRSLGILADTNGFSTIRLPYELTAASYTGEGYAISPLLIMQSLGETYYLIDVDFDQPRLYAGTQYSLELIDDLDLPGAIDDVIETEQRRNMSGQRGGAGGTGVTHFGRGEADHRQANDISRYLQLLAAPINDYLKDKSDPLFIAGSPKVIAEFRSMLDYGHVHDDGISANYDQQRLHELHQNSLAAMTEIARAKKAAVLARYADLDFDLRADGMTAVEAAAEQGRVDTLLIPVVRVTPDGVDSDDQATMLIELPEDFAAFESVVRQVADQGGKVVAVEQADFADDPSMKAILRY